MRYAGAAGPAGRRCTLPLLREQWLQTGHGVLRPVLGGGRQSYVAPRQVGARAPVVHADGRPDGLPVTLSQCIDPGKTRAPRRCPGNRSCTTCRSVFALSAWGSDRTVVERRIRQQAGRREARWLGSWRYLEMTSL